MKNVKIGHPRKTTAGTQEWRWMEVDASDGFPFQLEHIGTKC